MLLAKAKHGLGAARLLAKHDYNNAAVSEAYYVMFHAVKALAAGGGAHVQKAQRGHFRLRP